MAAPRPFTALGLALALAVSAAPAAEPTLAATPVGPQPVPAAAEKVGAPEPSSVASAAVSSAAAGPEAPPPAASKPPQPEPELPATELPDALKNDDDTSLGWALVRTVVVLGLVLMIVWLTLNFGLRRLLGIKGPMGGPSVVTVLERIPLDPKRTLFVVKAAGEYLLLGGGDGAVGLVAKLDAVEAEKLLARPQGGVTLSPLLARLLSKKNS